MVGDLPPRLPKTPSFSLRSRRYFAIINIVVSGVPERTRLSGRVPLEPFLSLYLSMTVYRACQRHAMGAVICHPAKSVTIYGVIRWLPSPGHGSDYNRILYDLVVRHRGINAPLISVQHNRLFMPLKQLFYVLKAVYILISVAFTGCNLIGQDSYPLLSVRGLRLPSADFTF